VPTELGEAVTNLLKDKMPNIVNVNIHLKWKQILIRLIRAIKIIKR